MNPRTTGLLALIAVALGLFVYFHEIEGDVARRAADEQAKQIHAGLDATRIDALELTTLDGVDARFERHEGRWQVVSPIVARADGAALDAITHALANLPREGRVDAAGSLDGFGLGDGAQTVRFEIAGETLGLRIGGTTPVGGHRYVARLADDEVAYVASYRVNAFKRNLADLRDRRIFDFEAGEIRTLRVAWPRAGGQETEVALARDDAGEWHLGAPLVARADQEVVRDLLSDLVYLRASGFVDAPDASDAADPEAVRRAQGETLIRFYWTTDDAHLERFARLAGEVGDDRVVEGADGRVYLVPKDRLDDFPRAIVDYRFKQLSSFEVSAARRLELELLEAPSANASGGLRVVAELEGSGWSSAQADIDPDRVTRMVRELASLKAIDIVAEEMGPDERASVGLDPPRARIRVEGGADPMAAMETLADLMLGRFDPDRGVFAQRAGDATIYLLDPASAEDLPISADRFRAGLLVAADEEDAEVPPDSEDSFESFEPFGAFGEDDAQGEIEAP